MPGCIHISETTFRALPPDLQPLWQYRGPIEVKGKGAMDTYLFARDGAGRAAAEGAAAAGGQATAQQQQQLQLKPTAVAGVGAGAGNMDT